jgi:cytosine permease
MKNEIIKQNWLQLASIQMGGVICLPLLFIGYELAKFCHPLTAFCSILWGNLFLFALSLVSGWLSVRKHNVTAQNALSYFGDYGRIFFASIMTLSMLGWFAFQAQCAGGNICSLFEDYQGIKLVDGEIWKGIFSSVIAAAVIAGAFFGVKMLTRIAMCCLPIMVISIGYFIVQAHTFTSEALPFISTWSGQAVSLVLAANIAGTIDLPTFYRHARNYKDTLYSSFLVYMITIPIIEYLGACLYYSSSASTIHGALANISSSTWKIWTILFVLLTGWTTNNLNLYSAANSLKVLYKKFTFPQAVGIVGLLGLFFITIPMIERFSMLSNMMGVFVVSMGAVILTAFMFEIYGIQPNYKLSWMAWFCGAGVGLAELNYGHLGTGAFVLDAGIIAALIIIVGNLLALIKNPKRVIVDQVCDSFLSSDKRARRMEYNTSEK